MSKRIIVTIDTEMDADIHWIKKHPRTYSSITEGIPKFYRPLWDEYMINPIYFVSPEILEDDLACNVIKNEIQKGALIGAHLHPDFIEPDETPRDAAPLEKFPCFGYSYEIEKEKIRNLKNKIERRLGVTPIWYRAARFGTDNDTIKILAELGFKHDSSFTPGINWTSKGGPDHSSVNAHVYKLEPYDILEHPITILGKRWGILGNILPDNWLFYRWLRPTHMTYMEEKRLIREMSEKKADELVMMFHSMEIMINKTPYVRTKLMQLYFIWRLKKTLSYVKKMGYESYKHEKGANVNEHTGMETKDI